MHFCCIAPDSLHVLFESHISPVSTSNMYNYNIIVYTFNIKNKLKYNMKRDIELGIKAQICNM